MLSMLAVLGGADCERIRSDWLAQPASALSSLAYLAVGIWLLRRPTAVAAGVHRSVLLPGGSALA
ncbi:MAG TPA: hypothetical protein VEG38_22475, partial [Acidimicrobiia bacterium]|nr:hypothetical protein [Acidimicrobiia bacterium]